MLSISTKICPLSYIFLSSNNIYVDLNIVERGSIEKIQDRYKMHELSSVIEMSIRA